MKYTWSTDVQNEKKKTIFNELLLISAYKYHKMCCVYSDIGKFFGMWGE